MTATEAKLREELAELIERQRGPGSYRLMDKRSARMKKVRAMIAKLEAKRAEREAKR